MRMAPLAALVFGAVCFTGCDKTFDNLVILPSTTGTFVLESANGLPLPAIVVDSVTPALRVEVVSGSIILRTDGTFEESIQFATTANGVQTTNNNVCSGTFFVSGTTITFNENAVTENTVASCGATFTGILNGNTLTTTIRGVALVFVR